MARSVGWQAARIIKVMALVGAVLVGVVVGTGSAVGAQEDAATDQRVVRLVGNYEVRPELGRVDVVEEITVSNVRGSTRSGNTVTSYFWTGHTVWAPADAKNLSIQVDGNELEWEVFDTISGIDIIAADYRRNLNFGQTRVIDVTYSLPTYGPDIGGRRINSAFFDFQMVTCCGFEEIDLTISMPADFDVEPANNLRFRSTVVGDRLQYTFSDNEVTGQFTELIFSNWTGFNEAGMERTVIDGGSGTDEGLGTPVELVYPPDDRTWAARTSGQITEIGTALRELIGAPFPAEGLVIRQGPNEDFDRWGLDGPFDDALVLPRDYDERGLAATLARAWLADGPFVDGVVRDGVALEFAAEAIVRTGGQATTLAPPSRAGELDDQGRQWVIRQVVDQIGYDGLTELVEMARNDETAYVGTGAPEQVATVPGDWKRFVDLAEQRLGADEVAALFADHALDAQASSELDARADAIDGYEALDRALDGEIPVGIRTAMTNWDFEGAQTLLTAAGSVVEERDRVIGDDPERATDEELALGDEWATAESVEDLEAVRSAILDRESALERGRLIRFALIGLGAVVVIAAVIGGLLFRSRRRDQDAGPVAPPASLTPPGQPAAGPVPDPATGWAPPSGNPSPGNEGQTVPRSTLPGTGGPAAPPDWP